MRVLRPQFRIIEQQRALAFAADRGFGLAERNPPIKVANKMRDYAQR
jgi:hypothetical protein